MRNPMPGLIVVSLFLFSIASPPLAAQASAAPSCDAPEHRQFDFWVGTWEVSTERGVAGSNRITLTLDGCVLHEHWVGAQGGTGESFNFYDRQTGRWHQLWIDNRGGVLRFSGAYRDGAMALTGQSRAQDGATIDHRLTFYNQVDEGTVRQVWEQSRDGAATWQTVFDGLYRKSD